MTARLFVSVHDRVDLEIIHGFVMERVEDVGGSSRSGQIVTTCQHRDGW